MLVIWSLFSFPTLCLSHPTTNALGQAQLQPLLTTAKQTPELSTFYSLFSSTGGDSSVPGPSLEERFNDPTSPLQYTLLAPTNDAFASITPAFLEALTSIPSYELLLTLLRNYFVPENLTLSEFTPKSGIQTVGGFMLNIEPDGSIQTNEGVTKSAVPVKKQANIILDESGRPVTILASNGIIYLIDKMFDPLVTYFGEDAPGEGLPPITRQLGTMADILRQHQDLTTFSPLMAEVDPKFVDRFSLYSSDPAVDQRTVYLVPSNSAFEVLPSSTVQSAMQPSNQGADSLLLEFGLGEYNEGDPWVRSASGFNITAAGGRANNAGVQERVCAENGCVWLVGRWLDPLYGAFV